MGMPIEVRDRWVAALRSGEYEQGTGTMRDTKGRYCCLGVLCDTLSKEPEAFDGLDSAVNTHLYDLVFGDGMVADEAWVLAQMNDEGTTFAEIADYIEQNVPVS